MYGLKKCGSEMCDIVQEHVPFGRIYLYLYTVTGQAIMIRAAWNSLPVDVRRAPTLDKFKQCLKTHLFYTVILLIV